MAYERQVQIAMERLDQSLAKLYTLIKMIKNMNYKNNSQQQN